MRDHQFEEKLQNRLDMAEREKDNAVQPAEANLKNALEADLVKKDNEISNLKSNFLRQMSAFCLRC